MVFIVLLAVPLYVPDVSWVDLNFKKGLRDVYQASSRQDALNRFAAWESSIPDNMEPLQEVAETIHIWQAVIFNYFDCQFTNAFTESFNNVIRSIERQGRGYSYPVFRAKSFWNRKKEKAPVLVRGFL